MSWSRWKSGRFVGLLGILGTGTAAKVAAVGVAVAVLAVAAGGPDGQVPRDPNAAARDRAAGADAVPPKPAPKQQWAAAGKNQQHVVGKPANKTLPVSMRGRYPAVKWKPPLNTATVVPKKSTVRGYDEATSKPAAAQPNAYEKVYDNTDGTQTTEFSAAPVNYRAPDGTWQPIDTTLTRDGTGWRNTADEVGVGLAGTADDPALATITFDATHSVAYSLAGVSASKAEAGGSALTYRGIRPGVDLRLEAKPGGVKETLVLAGKAAPATFVFPLKLTGLTARLDGDRVLLYDEKGAQRGEIPAGVAVDAKGGTSTAKYELVDGPALKVTVDQAWLDDSRRAFPVELDPTVQVPVNGAAADSSMYVSGSSSASGGTQLLVGSNAASYLKFGSLVGDLQYHTIFGAKLWLVNYDADSCRPRPVSVHPVTGSWSAGSGYSYPGPAVGGSLAGKSFAHGYIAFGSSSSACPTEGELIDLGAAGRDLVQRWVNGTQANYGLSVRGSAGKKFAGTGTANPPRLYVTHTPYYATYSIPNPVPDPVVLQNQNGKIKVAVTNKSAAAWGASDYYLAYRAYNAVTGAAVTQQRSANLTGTVARGARVTLDATIKALPPGKYFLDFTMVKTGGPVFTDYQVPPARLVLQVFDIPPVVEELYPPNGYQAPTLTPQLWARALDIDAVPSSTLQFKFEVCDVDSAGKPVTCTNSGYTTKTAWTVPAGRMVWSKAYQWRTYVKDATTEVTSPYSTVLTQVPQPGQTTGDSSDQDFDPQSGNYTTEALDASVTTAGPELRLIRTYNSIDPRRDSLFGAGWTSRYDMKIVADDDGSGNVVITYPDGQQVRFGRNPDGTYAAPSGRIATLLLSSTGYQLTDSDGSVYQFSLTGKLTKILDVVGRALNLTYNTSDGKLAKAQVSNSQTNTAGRSLTFTFTGAHVATVATDAVNGAPLTWYYTYTGDLLTKVCAPGQQCTSYEYAAGSHYPSTVRNDRPESYWRLGEPDGTAAASEVAVNLGKDAGTYKNATLAQAGVLTGSADTAALFNGGTSSVDLPKGTLKKSRDAAVELWFKQPLTSAGGPLAGYQDKALDTASTTGVPILYVGTDGKLRGQFATGTIAPITSATTVNDNRWHHVVLSAMGSIQTLYLDNVKVGTLTGTIEHSLLTFNQIGAAYASTPASWPGWGTVAQRSFGGYVDEVAYYTHPVGAASIAAHFKAIAQADQLSKITLPSGKVAASAVYDVDKDRLKEETDENGGTWKLGAPVVYGGDTDLRRSVEVLDPADRPSLYEYDAIGGWLLRLGIPLGIEAEDDQAQPSPSPSTPPTQTCSTPDPNDPAFCTTIPDDSGGPVFVRYDADGVSIRTFAHNDDGSVGTVTDENGNTVTMTYNSRGAVTSTKQCRTSTECHTTYATYPATVTNATDPRNDQPIEVRDGRSASATDNTYKTSYTYHSSGQPLTQTNPDGGVIVNTYTTGTDAPAGLLATSTDARGKVTRFTYYANGDVASITAPSGLVTSYTYDAVGRKISEKQVSDSFPGGLTTTYTYDGMGRLLTQLDPATTDAVTAVKHQQRTTNKYDADGNVTETDVEDAAGTDTARVTTYDYDDFNRKIRVTDAEGHETEYGYDGFGNTVSATDANGNRFDYVYTARNNIAEVRLRDWHSDPAGTPAPATGDYLVLRDYSYDLAGQQVSATDAMGRRTETSYYRDGLAQKTVLKGLHNPDGTTRDFVLQDSTYDGAGNLTKQVTDNGLNAVTHTYDNAGQVKTTVNDPAGLARTTAYTYDLGGNVTHTEMSGKASNVPWAMSTTPEVADYEIDPVGNVTKETVTDGTTTQVTRTGFDQRGLETSEIDPRGNTTTYRYDELGRQIAAVGAPVPTETGGGAPVTTSPTTTTGYNTFGETVTTKDALGQVTTIAVDRLGRPVLATAPSYLPPGGSTAIQPTAKTSYDANGNVVSTTDARNNTTRTTYDQLNRVVSVDAPASTDSERAVTSYTYTRTGQPLSETGPTGARAESTYDDMDRQVTSTVIERQPAAQTLTTTATYDDAGNVTKVVSPLGTPTLGKFDTLGQQIESTDPAGVVTQLGYDFSGRQVRIGDSLGTTRTTYDRFGQTVGQTQLKADGSVLSSVGYQYDLGGNVIGETDALQHTTTYQYDAGNRLTKQVQPVSDTESITTSYGYDAAGNQTRYTDGRGNATITAYNSLGLEQTKIDPPTTAQPNAADRTWTSTYDAAGNLIAQVAPGGVRGASEYDAAGRISSESGIGAEATTATNTVKYDLAGQVISATGASGTNTYAYDDRGDLLSAAGPGGNATFRYDGDGNQTSRADAAGAAVFGYTKSRLTSVTDALTGTSQQLGYDAVGQLKTIGYGAGRTRTYTYDDSGNVAADTLTNSAGATVTASTYQYDLAGRLASEKATGTAADGTSTYGYDYAGRLTSQAKGTTTTAYAWDAAGNRTKAGAKTASYDERNRLLADGDYTYSYTPRGTMKTRTSSGLTEQFSFDALDRLTDAAGQKYTYDGLDRVATRNGVAFAYGGLDDEIVNDGTSTYSRGPGDELLATGTGSTERLAVSDRHGDVVGGIDPADTTMSKLSDSTSYDPFGTVTAKTGNTGAVGFQGDWTDPGTGQVDMGDRWYNPSTAGFTSRDSEDTSDSDDAGNRYAYAAGDPLDRIDPDGHKSCKKILFWSFSCGGGSSTVAPCSSFFFCWLTSEMPYSLSDALRQQANNLKRQATGKMQRSTLPSTTYPSYAPGRAGSGGSGVSCGACYRESPYERAKKVSDAARSANAYAAAHSPISVKNAARSPVLNMPHAVSSSPSSPAHTTGTSKDVVSDQRKGTTAIYDAAVGKAGNVVSNVSKAAAGEQSPFDMSFGDFIGALRHPSRIRFGMPTPDDLLGVAATPFVLASWVVDGLKAAPGATWDFLGGPEFEKNCIYNYDPSTSDQLGCLFDVGIWFVPEVRVPLRLGKPLLSKAGRELSEDVAGAACAAAGNSFTGDTEVRLADGSTEKISEVQVGEKVKATDPATGREGSYAVTDVIVGTGEKHLVAITLDDGATVTATDGHPFWAEAEHRWVDAGDLAAGERIDGKTIRSVRSWTEQTTVYNLTVDTLHTFYVVAGGDDLLVHNVDWAKCGKALKAPLRWGADAGRGAYDHVLTPIGHGVLNTGVVGRDLAVGLGRGPLRAVTWVGKNYYNYIKNNWFRASVQCLAGNALVGGGVSAATGGDPHAYIPSAIGGCLAAVWKDSIPTRPWH